MHPACPCCSLTSGCLYHLTSAALLQDLDDALREARKYAGRQVASLQQDLQSAKDCIRDLQASLKQLTQASAEEGRQAQINSSQLQARMLELEAALKEERAQAAAQVFFLVLRCCCFTVPLSCTFQAGLATLQRVAMLCF